MKEWLNEHKIVIFFSAFIALGGIYYFYVSDFAKPAPVNTLGSEEQFQDNELKPENKNSEAKPEPPEKIMVDVKGQIKQPGVYQANKGERVIDVISRAGGLTDKADQGMVNLAEHVEDEMIIYIPALGEEGYTPPVTNSPAADGSPNGSKININKADETELQNLPGIGPSKAAAIIEYRSTSGPFEDVEDLKKISGIGDKTFEKLKELISI